MAITVGYGGKGPLWDYSGMFFIGTTICRCDVVFYSAQGVDAGNKRLSIVEYAVRSGFEDFVSSCESFESDNVRKLLEKYPNGWQQ